MSTKRGKVRSKRGRLPAILDYDSIDTTAAIDSSQALKFEDLGLRLPEVPPTQVVSIRLPSMLLNELRAISSQTDIPYQALIKILLSESVSRFKKKSAA